MKLRIRTSDGAQRIATPFLDLTASFSTGCGDWHFLASKFDAVIGVTFEDGSQKQVGLVETIRLSDAEADEVGCPRFELIDISQEIMDTCSPLIDWERDCDWTEEVYSVLDSDVGGRDIVMVNQLTVEPEFRGNNLGLWACLTVLRKIQFQGIAVLKPYPLQFGSYTRNRPELLQKLNNFTCTKKAGTRKLAQYYSRLGFESVPGTPMMIRSSAHCLPSLESLGLDIV